MPQQTKISAVHQILPVLNYRDAIGNEAFLMRETLRSLGLRSELYFESSGIKGESHKMHNLHLRCTLDQVFIHHFSVGSSIPNFLAAQNARTWTKYHNVTPPVFFTEKSDALAVQMTTLGRKQIPLVGFTSELILADSDYNGAELAEYCRKAPITLPIFRDYDALLRIDEDASVVRFQKTHPCPTILFVGRICPNKAQHDLIEFLYLYKKIYQKPIRLVLVGSFFSEAFKTLLMKFAKDLNLKISESLEGADAADLIVRGSVSDSEMASWYRHSQLFFSTSDHEGFGVPIVEAMFFDLPILAHRSSAVTETVGPAGELVDKYDRKHCLETLHYLLSNPEASKMCETRRIAHRQKFALKQVREQFLGILNKEFPYLF